MNGREGYPVSHVERRQALKVAAEIRQRRERAVRRQHRLWVWEKAFLIVCIIVTVTANGVGVMLHYKAVALPAPNDAVAFLSPRGQPLIFVPSRDEGQWWDPSYTDELWSTVDAMMPVEIGHRVYTMRDIMGRHI